MFSELGDLSEPRRRAIRPQLLAAIQCVRRWRKAGLGNDNTSRTDSIIDSDIETLYGMDTWDDDIDSDTDGDNETQHYK